MIRQGEPRELLAGLNGMVWNVYMDTAELRQYENEDAKIVSLTYAGEKICARILSSRGPEAGIAERQSRRWRMCICIMSSEGGMA